MKLPALQGEILPAAPLARLTSVRVGGNADVLVRPAGLEDLMALVASLADQDVPLHPLGGGANTIVADAGIAGVVVRLPPTADLVEQDATGASITLGAGTPIARVSALMRTHRLVGAEFWAGIPGTLGGALAMNAGTKNGEASRVVEAAEVVTPSGARWLSREELGFRYRGCALPERAVVHRVRIRLKRAADDAELSASRAAMEADLAYRRKTQPQRLPSSGSVFQNPPGDFAGRLIEAAGLKGLRRGGARIAQEHANWIVNAGEASGEDVRFLMETARATVLQKNGVHLESEVKLVGRWETWTG